jgi:hypothetical protein
MGWLWGSDSSDGSKPALQNTDPLRDLDPSLRSFLEKESPVKYKTSQPPPEPPTDVPKADPTTDEPSAPKVPTLFPDGRYAHLWKNYKPLSSIEAATKSDQDKLLDVVAGYRDRRVQIGVAALTNCAMEQWDLNECFHTGGFKARMTMCRAENRKFERCYVMQSRFLRALGYLSTYDRPPEVDEEIQMHADKLYHRMLERERLVEEAKAKGEAQPVFPPLMDRASPNFSTGGQQEEGAELALPKALDSLQPRVKKEMRARLKGLTPEEKDIEERAIEMEMQAGEILAKQLSKVYEETGENRAKRKEQGRQTFGDRIASIFGW